MGNYAPPTGQAPPQQYHSTAAGYRPPQQGQQQGFSAPYGPPPVRPPSQAQTYGPQMGGGQQPFFQYSQCTGARKALCVSAARGGGVPFPD